MSYSALLPLQSSSPNFIAVLKPRRIVDGFTGGSNPYQVAFDYGEVVGVIEDGVSYSSVSDVGSITNSTYYYDSTDEVLYVGTSDGTNPSNFTIVVTYEIYTSTFDGYGGRVPTDDNTRTVYYEPLLVRSPNVSLTQAQNQFGYIPISTAGLNFSTLTGFWDRHVDGSSFSNAGIDIYHWLGDFKAENIKKVSSVIARDFSFTDSTMNLSVLNDLSLFGTEIRNSDIGVGTESFLLPSLLPNLESQRIFEPIRRVFGVVEDVEAGCTNYDENTTVTNNRLWMVRTYPNITNDDTESGKISLDAATGNSNTRTYYQTPSDLTNTGMRVGDTITLFNGGTAQTYSAVITDINKGSQYIDHSTILVAIPDNNGNIVRAGVSAVKIIQDGIVYDLFFGTHYTLGVDLSAGNFERIQLVNDVENLLGMTRPIDPKQDKVYTRIYGQRTLPQIGGSDFGSFSLETGTLTNPIVIMYYLITEMLGVAESDIDTTSFTAALSSNTQEVGIAFPEPGETAWPSYKDAITKIAETALIKFYKNSAGKWAISTTEPLSGGSTAVDETDFVADSYTKDVSYNDIYSDIRIKYKKKYLDGANQQQINFESEYSTSDRAKYLHNIDRTYVLETILFLSSDASDLAERLGYILGDQTSIISFQTDKTFFETEISDNIQLTNPNRNSGLDVDTGVVISTKKALDNVIITIDEQLGIENNSGSW